MCKTTLLIYYITIFSGGGRERVQAEEDERSERRKSFSTPLRSTDRVIFFRSNTTPLLRILNRSARFSRRRAFFPSILGLGHQWVSDPFLFWCMLCCYSNGEFLPSHRDRCPGSFFHQELTLHRSLNV